MADPTSPGASSTRRVAAIDVGTNTVLLTIAERREGMLEPLVERATITRLGRGVDRTKALSTEARTRTLDCLREYARAIDQAGVDAVGVVGTSALRDARGGDEFIAEARGILGVPLEVISGRREAELTFAGATGTLLVTGPVAVIDIGGGSTEIILGEIARLDDGTVATAISRADSLDVGSVRLTERHVHSDPPRPEELEAVRADAHDALTKSSILSGAQRSTWIGVAGTVTTLAAIAAEQGEYDAARVHGSSLSEGTLTHWIGTLSALPLEARQKVPGLEPLRADVIIAGALIFDEVLRAARVDRAVVSDRGVRWGILAELL